jgi:DNA replication and repair protein RecF
MIELITIEHFRNIRQAQLAFEPGLTLLVGANGQGKTNVLEAIYLLCQARDFRTALERDAIEYGQAAAMVRGAGDRNGRRWSAEHRIQKMPFRRQHQGELWPAVIFTPDDVRLAKAGPDVRRDFLDALLETTNPRYRQALKQYRRIVSQRNRALKDHYPASVLESFTPLLIETGWYIWQTRQLAVQQLFPLAERVHGQLSGGDSISYQYRWGGADRPVDGPDAFTRILTARLVEERLRQQTLVGPHRDDLVIYLNDQIAAVYASQGQLRTIALSLRLASYDWLWQETGVRPVILLDDILSELDPKRRQQVLAKAAEAGQQAIVTDTEARDYRDLGPVIYHVEQGAIQR